jgi:hypothetical protein
MKKKTLIEPGKLYPKASAEGIVIRLMQLARFIADADLSHPEQQAAAKRNAEYLLRASVGTITAPLN